MAILYLLPVYNQNEAIHIHIVTIFRTSNHRNVREIKDCNYSYWQIENNISTKHSLYNKTVVSY